MKKYSKKKKIIICIILAIGLISIPVGRGIYFFVKGFKALVNSLSGQATRHLEKSVKANPYFLEAYFYLALAYVDWAGDSLHYIQQDEESLLGLKTELMGRAEELLKTALKRFPYHPYRDDIQFMLGSMYDEDHRNSGYIWDRDKAIKDYRELIKKYPKSRYVKKARERIEVLNQTLSAVLQ